MRSSFVKVAEFPKSSGSQPAGCGSAPGPTAGNAHRRPKQADEAEPSPVSAVSGAGPTLITFTSVSGRTCRLERNDTFAPVA